MKRFLMCLALLTTTPLVLAEYLPRDVQRFVDRREGCDHMRGEIPARADGPRMQDIGRQIDRQCKGTDKELAQLKKKYAANSTIMQILNQFEADIEAVEAPARRGKSARQAGSA
jgi:hypothetical protein